MLSNLKNEVNLRKPGPGLPYSKPRFNPSLEKTVENSFNLTTRYGFPVLEGFASKWKPGKSSKIQNKLEDWVRSTENDETRATLSEVNSLPSVDTDEDVLDQLYNTAEKSLKNPSTTFGEGDLFGLLSDARGDTQHGEEFYTGPASVVVTLSCLAFWDLIDEGHFAQLRGWLEQSPERDSENQEVVRDMYWKPEDFYNPATVKKYSSQLP